jgi:hypothetical protein
VIDADFCHENLFGSPRASGYDPPVGIDLGR